MPFHTFGKAKNKQHQNRAPNLKRTEKNKTRGTLSQPIIVLRPAPPLKNAHPFYCPWNSGAGVRDCLMRLVFTLTCPGPEDIKKERVGGAQLLYWISRIIWLRFIRFLVLVLGFRTPRRGCYFLTLRLGWLKIKTNIGKHREVVGRGLGEGVGVGI